MLKKRVAIVTNQMITGGVERALLLMLRNIDFEKYDVHLFAVRGGGELTAEIPDGVRFSILKPIDIQKMLVQPSLGINRLKARIRLLRKLSFAAQCRETAQMYEPIKNSYDVAIAYHAPNTVPVFYVIDRIDAKKKILWLHGDMEHNSGKEFVVREYHERYDKIVAVSKAVADSFVRIHPDKANATETIYNYCDVTTIRKMADANIELPDDGGFRIVTVGRLSDQKGIDLAVEACQILTDRGLDVRWYVCGDGTEREFVEKQIRKYDLDNHFVLMGNQKNPYPFMKQCDLYVQTSRSEGYCTTTKEASVLNKAVITTDVSGAREQVLEGKTGWIVPIDAASIADRIEYCMKYPEKMQEIQSIASELPAGNEETDRRVQKLLR